MNRQRRPRSICMPTCDSRNAHSPTLPRPVSHLTAFGRQTPCSPSWRACDYADKLRDEMQRSFEIDAVPQLRRGIIRQSALSVRASPETGGVAPQECPVLPHDERCAGRRPVHEPDSYLRSERRELVRLSGGTTAPSQRVGGQPVRMDAVELPRYPGSRRRRWLKPPKPAKLCNISGAKQPYALLPKGHGVPGSASAVPGGSCREDY